MIRGQSRPLVEMHGKQGDGKSNAWGELPADILQQVTALLDFESLQSARLVSRVWCRGLSQGVRTLQPRMEANAIGLQWSELHKLQAAFPAIRELDLRQRPPLYCHARHFASLTSLRRLYVSSLQRSAEPKVLLSELRDFAKALQAYRVTAKLDLELRFGESSLIWGTPSAPFADSDADIQAVSELPANIEVTMLHMPQLCYAISADGLASVMRLTSLRHLRLVTYGAHITDADFRCLAGLVHLEHLWFGVVPYVSDAGLLAGLGSLTHLRELFLYDVGGITDSGIEALAASLEALEGLSLSKCHRLTNKGLASLARLPLLSRLFLSENEHITCAGADRFPDGLKSLTMRQCPNVNRSDHF